MTRRSALTALVLAVVMAACGGGDRASFSRAPTTPPGPAPSATTSSTLAAATSPTCPAIPPRAAPDPGRPRYTLRVDVRPAEGFVDGDLRVRFTPDLDTDRLVFRLWPNGPRSAAAAARLETGQVTVGGRDVDSALEDATTLVVRAGGPFPAGRPVDIAMPWQLRVPGAANDRISRNGDALRLGSFFPILPWEPGVGWATDTAVGGFAEASTAPTADFEMTVTVPAGFDVLASGTADPGRPGHYTATAMRDVALSVGRFQTVSAVVMAPERVDVTVGVHRGIADSPTIYLDRVVESLEDFGRRFGPYPWPTFTMAITPDLGGGIEYPTHVMQGPGTLGVASHEVAHQWFYGLVGNNQGRDPWLDEGLASWAEARFEGRLERFKARVIPEPAKNRVGEPMTYWAGNLQVYTEGVYVQGAQALAALGTPELVDCALRVFVAVNAYRVARQADLVTAAAAVFPNARSTLASYGVKA